MQTFIHVTGGTEYEWEGRIHFMILELLMVHSKDILMWQCCFWVKKKIFARGKWIKFNFLIRLKLTLVQDWDKMRIHFMILELLMVHSKDILMWQCCFWVKKKIFARGKWIKFNFLIRLKLTLVQDWDKMII